ncbi:MAG: hypothetical protein C4327_11155 [Meiothermus sp.]
MDCQEALKWYELRWAEDRRRWEEEKRALEKRLEEQTEEILDLRSQLGKLQRLSSPPLGEGFFRYLAQALEQWDQVLVEQARQLDGGGIEPWLRAIWRQREAALSQMLAGEAPDWRQVRTGLVLEWALLTWLEGVRDG